MIPRLCSWRFGKSLAESLMGQHTVVAANALPQYASGSALAEDIDATRVGRRVGNGDTASFGRDFNRTSVPATVTGDAPVTPR